MEFYANEGKQVCIDVEGNWYMRHAIHTHRIGVGEDYSAMLRRSIGLGISFPSAKRLSLSVRSA